MKPSHHKDANWSEKIDQIDTVALQFKNSFEGSSSYKFDYKFKVPKFYQ